MKSRLTNMTQEIVEQKSDLKVKSADRKTKQDEKAQEKKVTSPTKVVVRRLPPTLTRETFLEQVSPIAEYDYLQFVRADLSLGSNAFSRAYINFLHSEDIFLFREKFDGYVFVDNKGNEYTAVVEFAPFQKIPKSKTKKIDSKKGTITHDSDYLKFVEALKKLEPESIPPPEAYLQEIEAREKELKANSGVLRVSTPLLEYIKKRREEKRVALQRAKDERKRRETERRRIREDERRRKKDVDRPKEMERKHDDVQVKLLKNPERVTKGAEREKDSLERGKRETGPASSSERPVRPWDKGKEGFDRIGRGDDDRGHDGKRGEKGLVVERGKDTREKMTSIERGKDTREKMTSIERGKDAREKMTSSSSSSSKDLNRPKPGKERERERIKEKDRPSSTPKKDGRDNGTYRSEHSFTGSKMSSKTIVSSSKPKELISRERTPEVDQQQQSNSATAVDTAKSETSGKKPTTLFGAWESSKKGRDGAEESGTEVPSRQRVRGKDRPDRAIYNPGRRAAERRKEAEAKAKESTGNT